MTEIPTYTTKQQGLPMPGENMLFEFDCPCGERHYHSLPKPYKPEHRVAHCTKNETHPDGYYILWRPLMPG